MLPERKAKDVLEQFLGQFYTQLSGLLYTISLRDVADVALVAILFYQGYIRIRNTKAESLIKGIVMMMVLTQAARWLNLYVVHWVLEKALSLGAVALTVVFQPELRRGLEQLGRYRITGKGSQVNDEDITDMIGAVTDAALIMSNRKVGALIVFEREESLDERIETGVRIDGVLSDSLLLNIFEKDTPLHDGAVIVRGNRIAAASCILPLTESRHLSQELGTRHRAAIGISEQTDCIVLVVSEETGIISIARNGEIFRRLTADDIKEMLGRGLFIAQRRETYFEKLKNRLANIWQKGGGENG